MKANTDKNDMQVLNVGHILLESRANGPGLRAVVWVQGCSLRCEGCINQDLLSHKTKYLVDPYQLMESILKHSPRIEGISISGGEPFEQAAGCAELLRAAKQKNLSTLVFTGYYCEDLVKSESEPINEMIENIDILIDGPFILERAGNLLWRGSSNQRILLLSDYYNENDVLKTDLPREEIIFNSDSRTIIQTGIITKTTLLSESFSKVLPKCR